MSHMGLKVRGGKNGWVQVRATPVMSFGDKCIAFGNLQFVRLLTSIMLGIRPSVPYVQTKQV